MTYQLVCCGNPNDISTWSNIPYYILHAASKNGLLVAGPSLDPSRLLFRRLLWNISRLILTGKPGGFQYSKSSVNSLWSQAISQGYSSTQNLQFLSHFPLLPPYPYPDNWKVSFYIDATNKQLFENYQTGHRLSHLLKKDVFDRERNAYMSADAVITMSKWAAQSVINDYQIPSERVHIVPAGANFNCSVLNSSDINLTLPAPTHPLPLKLGFLGKDWQRKGGPFVLQLASYLNSIGIPAIVRVVGPSLSDLPISPLIQYVGFIDKHTEHSKFIREISSWHFGTLFSLFEAYGISNVECFRLAVPVLTHDVGGISSTFTGDECGKLFSAHPSVETVGNYISHLMSDYESYLLMRARLALNSLNFEWQKSVARICDILYS